MSFRVRSSSPGCLWGCACGARGLVAPFIGFCGAGMGCGRRPLAGFLTLGLVWCSVRALTAVGYQDFCSPPAPTTPRRSRPKRGRQEQDMRRQPTHGGKGSPLPLWGGSGARSTAVLRRGGLHRDCRGQRLQARAACSGACLFPSVFGPCANDCPFRVSTSSPCVFCSAFCTAHVLICWPFRPVLFAAVVRVLSAAALWCYWCCCQCCCCCCCCLHSLSHGVPHVWLRVR